MNDLTLITLFPYLLMSTMFSRELATQCLFARFFINSNAERLTELQQFAHSFELVLVQRMGSITHTVVSVNSDKIERI